MIKKARKLGIRNCQFKVIDSARLDFPEGKFDVAVFFNVIHHIDSKKKLVEAFSEAGRVVKKGGLVVVVDMNPYNPVTRHVINTNEIDKAVSLGGFKRGKFPTTLTPDECKKMLARRWLYAKYTEYLIFFPQVLSFFLPLENILKKIPLGGLYMVGAIKK